MAPFALLNRHAKRLRPHARTNLRQYQARTPCRIRPEKPRWYRLFSVRRNHPKFIGLFLRQRPHVAGLEDKLTARCKVNRPRAGNRSSFARRQHHMLRSRSSQHIQYLLRMGILHGSNPPTGAPRCRVLPFIELIFTPSMTAISASAAAIAQGTHTDARRARCPLLIRNHLPSAFLAPLSPCAAEIFSMNRCRAPSGSGCSSTLIATTATSLATSQARPSMPHTPPHAPAQLCDSSSEEPCIA